MARARSYRHDIACPHCGSNWMRKDGHSRGKQTYRCGDCQHRHTPAGNRHYYPESVKRQAVAMYSEGMSMSAVARSMGVSLSAVFTWVKKSPVVSRCDEHGARATRSASV